MLFLAFQGACLALLLLHWFYGAVLQDWEMSWWSLLMATVFHLFAWVALVYDWLYPETEEETDDYP